MLGEVRRMMGEEAAMLAYRGFIRSVLGFGCEVMVWDRVGMRNKMDVVQRKALRVVLVDRGARNELLYEEAGEDRLSAQAEWKAVKYGDGVAAMGEERLVRRVLDLRLGSRRDRWRKYIKGTMESLRSESGYINWRILGHGMRRTKGEIGRRW